MKTSAKELSIAGVRIKPGERKVIELIEPSLYTQTPMNIPVHVIHGQKKGPCLFITAAIHGDEINGTEIVRLLLNHASLKKIHGTLIAIPITNIYGLIGLSRYLPDRRDLNRSFPGSKAGSLASRLAYLLINEIIVQCTHGIDLHTGNIHVENFPHVRTNLHIFSAKKMAKSFGAPLMLDAKLRDGSLRQAAAELGIPVLVYEGGEALHFNEMAIQMGLKGVLQVMHALKMIVFATYKMTKQRAAKISYHSGWVRAPASGIIHSLKPLGSYVKEGDVLCIIADPVAKKDEYKFKSPVSGMIIGKNTLPLVNEGDALYHVAKIKNGQRLNSEFKQLQDELIINPITFF